MAGVARGHDRAWERPKEPKDADDGREVTTDILMLTDTSAYMMLQIP